MSSSDTNIRVNFVVTDGQLRRMFAQMKKLQGTVRNMSKNFTKLGNSMKKLEAKYGTTNKKVSKLTKNLKSQDKQQAKTRKSLDKLTSSTKRYGNATNKMTGAGNRASKSLGFTGLALGAVGGAALFAGNQIRQGFLSILEDTAPILSEISRLNIFASLGGGTLDLKSGGFEAQLENVTSKAQEFGISIEEMATLAKEVEKALPAGVNVKKFTDAIAGFAILEKGVPVAQLTSDFATIKSNFENLPADRIADLAFAFSGATKLSFSAGAKSIGFAAQAAKRLNTPLEGLLKTMVAIVNAVPGDRGTAGRGVRRLVSGLLKPEVLAGLQNVGVEIFDLQGQFVGLGRVMNQLANIYNTLNNQEQIRFIDDLSLTENALTAFLAFADKSVAERERLASEFNVEAGSFNVAVAEQQSQPEEQLNRLKNSVTILKLELVQGLSPALAELNAMFKDVFADKELINTFRLLGQAIGETLVGSIKAVLPIFQVFGNILKNNEVVVKALGVALVALTGALTGFGILFTLLGAFFALTFAHEALIGRSAILGARVTFVTKAYVRLLAVMNFVTLSMKKLITATIGGTLSQSRFATALTFSNLKLKFHAIQLAITSLAYRIFSISAVSSLLAIGAAWLIALAPIAIMIGAIIGVILLMRALQTQIVGVADQFDQSGNAGRNFADNMDGLFDIFETGSLEGVFDALKADFTDTQTRIGAIGAAWNVFMSDLQQTQAFQVINGAIQATIAWFQSGVTQIQNWIASLTFEIPDIWNIFVTLLGAIPQAFGRIGEAINQFLIDNNFPMPEIWAELDKIWLKITDSLKFITDPLNAFIEGLNFELPEPLVQLQKLIGDIANEFKKLADFIGSNPVIQAIVGGVGEVLGVADQFGKNVGKAFAPAPDRGNFVPEAPRSFFEKPSFIGPEQTPEFIGPLQSGAEGESGDPIVNQVKAHLEELGIDYVAQSEVIQESNDIMISNNELVSGRNEFLKSSNTIQNVNTQLVSGNSALTKVLNEHAFKSIVEFAKNINQMSALTTTISEVQLMLFNLIAEGNRAAGKLSSLKVSSSGKFSISDPGISTIDRSKIEAARANVASTKANQVTITINPEITINNAEGLNAADIVAEIDDQTANTLQKVFIQNG